MGNIKLLDCTLRDGAYIVNSNFGESSITGIIQKLVSAKVDIIECGWLKNNAHEMGSSFYNKISDIEPYIGNKSKNTEYCVMFDLDRYNLEFLEENNGNTIDAIRVAFPYGKIEDAILVGKEIIEKKYKLYFQMMNILAYDDKDIIKVCDLINEIKITGVYMADTFGAMYNEDVERISTLFNNNLRKDILLGLHTHNNQQMAFSNIIKFVNLSKNTDRNIIVDASLSGMGRGAGNATTELVSNYLNQKCEKNYDVDSILDAIDTYINFYHENYSWGYSTPNFIAGMYCCHINNVKYLLKNHRTKAKEMRMIIESLDEKDRNKYDYDLLEEKYNMIKDSVKLSKEDNNN